MGSAEDDLVGKVSGRFGLEVSKRWWRGAVGSGLIDGVRVEIASKQIFKERKLSTAQLGDGLDFDRVSEGVVRVRAFHRPLSSKGAVTIKRKRQGQPLSVDGSTTRANGFVSFGHPHDEALEVSGRESELRLVLGCALLETLAAFFQVVPNAIVFRESVSIRIGGRGSSATQGTNQVEMIRHVATMAAELDAAAARLP